MSHPYRFARLGISVFLLGNLACHTHAESNRADDHSAIDSAALDTNDAKRAPIKVRDRSVTLARGQAHSPHEVELDPRGEAALTLDPLGGLHLWPAIRSGDPALSSPYALPLREPLWMSLAQTDGKDGFVVAVIDTTNAAQVVAVRPDPAGKSAKLTPLLLIPPRDPILEIHVLDGGQRILALGVDHRVRLYDQAGALLSIIDERSFAPWQLRVVHAEAGQPPKIAAILAQPLRAQSISLRDDQLRLVGEARTVTLDRGPNRNDLLLSPDGKTIAGLRRPRARGRDFSIELIDLETDARRLIGGRTDSTVRSRMHFVDADRILLETGSNNGRGVWVELASAESLSDPADADPDSALAKRLYRTQHDTLALPASAEYRPPDFDPEWDEDWDHGERLHASVVAGIRVNIERPSAIGGTKLIVDSLASDRHLALSFAAVDIDGIALDQTGSQLALATGQTFTIEAVGAPEGSAPIQTVEHGMNEIRALAFVDDRHLLLVDTKGALRIYDWSSAAVVAELALELGWGIADIAYHRSSDMAGTLGYRSDKPGLPVRLIEIASGQIVEETTLSRDQRPLWIDILRLGDAEAGRVTGLGDATLRDQVDEYTSDRSGRTFYTMKDPRTQLHVDQQSFRLPAGQARHLSISPDGTRIAVVQFRARDDGRGREDHLLSVLDTQTGERLWTQGGTHTFVPTWSGDGQRIATTLEVRDAATGDRLHPNNAGSVVIQDRTDAEVAKQSSF